MLGLKLNHVSKRGPMFQWLYLGQRRWRYFIIYHWTRKLKFVIPCSEILHRCSAKFWNVNATGVIIAVLSETLSGYCRSPLCNLSCLGAPMNCAPQSYHYPWTQSLATNSPAPGPRPLICGVSSECLGTRSYETTSRDQCGKIDMFFSSTGAGTATKSPIANHRSSIVAQLYFASVTQMFLMPLFVKVESGSSKLLRTVLKSDPNGCKDRSRPQKILMRIKIESFLGRQNLVLTVTHSHKQTREEQKVIVTWIALIIITKFF